MRTVNLWVIEQWLEEEEGEGEKTQWCLQCLMSLVSRVDIKDIGDLRLWMK